MLTLSHITKSFKNNTNPVLKDMNLSLQTGDFCVVIGGNGSGKSTLLHLIAGEHAADSGHINLQGNTTTQIQRSQIVALVKQEVNQGTITEMTLLENLLLSKAKTTTMPFTPYSRLYPHLIQTLQTLNLGLEHHLHTPLKHLSGGQRQMIATLMAINTQPQLLLLDEHTSALDPRMQEQVMDLTAQTITTLKLTSLMVTHNLHHALRYGNRLIMLHQGRLVLDKSGEAKASLQLTELIDLFHHYGHLALQGENP